jgi:hypothetical protein
MNNIEFRNDDIERKIIEERNKELALSILDKAGINQENPMYDDLLVQTIENVDNVFRFSEYDDRSELSIIDLLDYYKDDIQAYKESSFDYKKSLAENQTRTATGSTFSRGGVIDYEEFEETIQKTIQSGLEMREEFQTKFPDIFYDEDGKLRERLVIEISYDMQESSAMGMIVNYARKHDGVVFDKEENRFMINGKPIGPEKFFRNKQEKLVKFVKQVENNADVLVTSECAFDDKTVVPNNLNLLFGDEKSGEICAVVPKGEEEKVKALADKVLKDFDDEMKISKWLSYDEMAEKYGVKVIDAKKEDECANAMDRAKSLLAKREKTDDEPNSDDKKVSPKQTSTQSGKFVIDGDMNR